MLEHQDQPSKKFTCTNYSVQKDKQIIWFFVVKLHQQQGAIIGCCKIKEIRIKGEPNEKKVASVTLGSIGAEDKMVDLKFIHGRILL
jgi:hypothetical protein